MTQTSDSAVPQPPPIPRRAPLVPWLLALCSTVAAFASHAWSGAPGDHPVPLLVFGCALAFGVGAMRMARPFVVGFAALSGFPIEATLDLLRHGGHSMLPFEFGLYAVYGLLGVLAARLGRTVGTAVSSAKG